MMKNKRKWTALVLAAMLLALAGLTGCTTETQGGGSAEPSVSAENPSSSGEEQTYIYDVVLNYANGNYIETGDESLPKLIAVGSRVQLEEADLTAAADQALQLLKDNTPALVSSVTPNPVTCVGDEVNVHVTEISGGRCVVDLSGESLMSQNMYTEMFMIYQIAATLMDSFDEISSVHFTVDGEETEALSYMDLTGDYTKELLNEFTAEQ
ncbi:MAG: GerMN domain-containing protein [Anaerovoracaceae bacterium]